MLAKDSYISVISQNDSIRWSHLREKALFVVFLSLFALLAASVNVGFSAVAAPTKVFVDPVTSTANAGDSFAVSVKVIEAADVHVFDVNLYWDKSVLNVTSVTEGDFLSHAGALTTLFTPKIYNDQGRLYVDDVIQGTQGTSGSGTLFTVNFIAKTGGSTGLFLMGVFMADTFNHDIPNILVEDGYVNVTPPTFHVNPASTIDPGLTVGSTFVANVTLSDGVEVHGFRLSLSFNSTVLNVTNAVLVPFLTEPVVSDVGFNGTTGLVWVNVNSTATDGGVTYSGPVATVTFTVNATGATMLDLSNIWLDDALARVSTPAFNHYPPAEDGYFENIPAGHNIQVMKVTVLPTKFAAGEIANINATIRNIGAFDETFDITVSYGLNVQITKKTGAFLAAGQRDVFIFQWDTSGLSAGSYIVKVQATLEGDAAPSDNVLSAAPIAIEGGPSTNWLMIAGAVAGIVVVAAVVALYFVKFRKPKTETPVATA